MAVGGRIGRILEWQAHAPTVARRLGGGLRALRVGIHPGEILEGLVASEAGRDVWGVERSDIAGGRRRE